MFNILKIANLIWGVENGILYLEQILVSIISRLLLAVVINKFNILFAVYHGILFYTQITVWV